MPSDFIQNRLFNQRLSGVKPNTPNELVTEFAAIQAQDYAGAKWALGQRLRGVTNSDLDQAFADGSILRTHLLRPTWHFVTPEDIRWLLKLTAPRVHAVNSSMMRQVDLDKPTVNKSYKVLEKALRGQKYLTRTELGSALNNAGISTEGLRLVYFMMSAELDGIICSGPRKGKQFTYTLLEERVHPVKELKRDEALAELTKRYFASRGPATLKDFTWWSGLTMTDVKDGIDMVKSEFVAEELDGHTYWFPESYLIKNKSATSYLLPNYDEYIVGYTDRNLIHNATHDQHLDARGNVLFQNTIVIKGQVKGTWKRTLKKDKVIVELAPFAKLTDPETQIVTQAIEQYGKFLGFQIKVTGRML